MMTLPKLSRSLMFLVGTPAVVLLLGLTLLITEASGALSRDQGISGLLVSQNDSERSVLALEIADTEKERTRGLSDRLSLASNRGLLFVFDETTEHGFWMKDMVFAIDILWLAADGTILHIEDEVSPDTYPTVYQPDVAAKYVLEVNSGTVKDLKLSEGDSVVLVIPGLN